MEPTEPMEPTSQFKDKFQSKLEMSDLVATYPSLALPHFQNLISAKREFQELASGTQEPQPQVKGQLYKHQELIKRYMQHYDRLLLMHETGTGKTCSVIGFTEWALRQKKLYYETNGREGTYFKRAYILVKGKTLREEIKKQIACVCSDGSYITNSVKNARFESTQKANVTREINKFYTVITYTSLANFIKRTYEKQLEQDSDFLEDFSDCIFWIDEGHNLRIDPSEAGSSEQREKAITYDILWKLLHYPQRIKIFISTATPAINDVKEFTPLLNLLNSLAKQIPVDFNYDSATLEQIEYYARGLISYVRAFDTGLAIGYEGLIYNQIFRYKNQTFQPQLTYVPDQMSEFQTEAYERSQMTSHESDLYEDERQASNFVYPDGKWGNSYSPEEKERIREQRKRKKTEEVEDVSQSPGVLRQTPLAERPAEQASENLFELLDQVIEAEDQERAEPELFESDIVSQPTHLGGFRRYVEKVGQDNYRAQPEFLPYISSLDRIAQLSQKYASICQIALNNNGIVFIYGDRVEGSGLVTLSLCLEALGLERYRENRSVFVGLEGGLKPYCSTQDDDSRIRSDFQAKPRYAMLTGQTPDARFNSMMELLNSYNNRHGDYIKVFISSPVGRDGINVNNVTAIQLVSGQWTQSEIHQATSRAIRTNSHHYLLSEMQEAAQAQGEDPSQVRVPIRIYQHCSISRSDRSIDLYMYLVSEAKDREIRKIYRMLKQIAIDCPIHRVRNISSLDRDGSRACDYQSCHYDCFDPSAQYSDESTFDLYYYQGLIESIIEDLRVIFRWESVATLESLVERIRIKPKHLIMALSQLISQKRIIYDQFGYQNYLVGDGHFYFLSRFYPHQTVRADSFYSNNIIASQTKSFDRIVSDLARPNQDVLAYFEQRLTTEELRAALNNLTLEARARLLEESILKFVENRPTPYTQQIIDFYRNLYYVFYEPVTEINKLQHYYATSDTRSGRKEAEETYLKIKRLTPEQWSQFEFDTETEVVYVHRLLTLEQGMTAHGQTSKIEKAQGNLRLLKPSEGRWRDMNSYELPVYNALVQDQLYRQTQKFEELPVFAKIIDHKFKIVNRRLEGSRAKTSLKDKARGFVCHEGYRASIFLSAFHLGVPIPTELENLIPNSQEEMYQYVRQHTSTKWKEEIYQRLTDPEYLYVWRWLQIDKNPAYSNIKSRYVTRDLCKLLERYARENDLIIKLTE